VDELRPATRYVELARQRRSAFLQREAQRLAAQDAWEEALFGLLLEGQISYDEMRELAPPVHADRTVERFRLRFSDEQLQSLPRAIAKGAKPHELLEVGVCGLNCEGEDLRGIPTTELRRRQKAVTELHGRAKPSTWLARYTSLLVNESRRRKGLGEAG
jgi:hypothetical protein